jgi:hypothetical protein
LAQIAAQAEDKAARARLGSQAVKTHYFTSHFYDALTGGAYGSGSLLRDSPPAVNELAFGTVSALTSSTRLSTFNQVIFICLFHAELLHVRVCSRPGITPTTESAHCAFRLHRKSAQVSPHLLDCHCIIFPILSGNHWVCALADLQRRQLVLWDSLVSRLNSWSIAVRHLENIGSWIVQEAVHKLGQEAASAAGWTGAPSWPKVVGGSGHGVPQQSNSVDCGAFVIAFAAYGGTGRPFSFGQADVAALRQRVTLNLMSGKWVGIWVWQCLHLHSCLELKAMPLAICCNQAVMRDDIYANIETPKPQARLAGYLYYRVVFARGAQTRHHQAVIRSDGSA